MSLPYIPGWWDEISKGVTGLASQLPQVLQPDRVAQRRLQDMVQQNPMLMEQFSNMDDATRAQLAQSLGFKNQNPLANLPVGAQRQERERIQGLRTEAMKDPTKADEIVSRDLGISSAQDRQLKGLQIKSAEQGLVQGDLNVQVLTGKVKEMKRLEDQIAEAQKAYPSLANVSFGPLIRDMIRTGKPIDNLLITAAENDPGAKQLFEIAKSVELTKYANELQLRLQRARDPNTSTILLRTLAELDNQYESSARNLMAERAQREANLQKDFSYTAMRVRANNGDAAAQAAVQTMEAKAFGPIDTQLNALRRAAETNRANTQTTLEKVGKQQGINFLSPAKETPEERLARIMREQGIP